MNIKSTRRGNKLDRLTEQWYMKLKAEGFKDIEVDFSKSGLYRRESPQSKSIGPVREGEVKAYGGCTDLIYLLQEYLNSKASGLDASETLILEKYCEGYTQKEVVDCTGMSLYKVSKSIKVAISKVLEEVQDYES